MHHNDLYDSVKTTWGKSGSCVKCRNVLANRIAGFLNFNISQTIGVIKLLGDKKLILFMKLHIYEGNKLMIKCRWVWPGMPWHAQRGFWGPIMLCLYSKVHSVATYFT